MQWPIHSLHQLMVYQIAICFGKLEDSSPLDDYHRIPAGGSIDGLEGELTFVMLAPPTSVPRVLTQESGTARMFTVVGVTKSEVGFAREHGGDALVQKLTAANALPVVNPSRVSVVCGSADALG